MKFTDFKSNNLYPCELMPFDWNIHENNNFCLNRSKCKLDEKLNSKMDLCFSFNKHNRTILYVLKNENFKSLDYNLSSPYINIIKNEIKQCPKDKIYNPQTKRCVLKSGKIGKLLLSSLTLSLHK